MWGVLRAARPSGRRFSPLLLLRRSTHNSREIPLALPAVCIWGANTGVGKTLVSAGLVAAAVRNQVAVQYIKPVQTGFPADCDARLVAAAAAASAGEAAAAALLPARRSTTLFAYADPVGPHLAAAEERRVVADADIVAGVAAQLQQFTAELAGAGSSGSSSSSPGLSVVETAGGVASPGPSGSLQGDLLRPLGLPALLVGDPALGGISTTLSAYESLLLRGQAPAALVMMADGRLNNVAAVRQQLRHAAAHRLGEALPVLELPLCRPPPASSSPAAPGDGGNAALIDAELAAWLVASQPQFDELLGLLQAQHGSRLAWLRGAAGAASSAVWWPFTQHAQLPSGDVTVVDARCGEDWLVYRPQQQQQQQQQAQGPDIISSSSEALVPLHDAACSWWTQTAAGPQLQLEVVRAAALAAGRYCHVMWPQVAHAPGLKLSQALLSGPLGAGWAGRVFFSDDGSTAVEVALKMAFRKFMVDAGLLDQHDTRLEVLALTNSYHGDTLGAMDCAAASAFNGRLQSPWYSGRGLFLQPPTLQLQQGQWRLQQPDWLQQLQQQHQLGSADWAWPSRQDALDVQQRHSSVLYCLYSQHINAAIEQHEAAAGSSAEGSSGGGAVRLGALLMEPVLQGAGGMLLVDPLFQAALVATCRSRRIPVIYDEVFAGCWRLGSPTAGQLLGPGAAPDIACYAKLLTAGVAPLAVTLASEAVFEAFSGPSKAEALLHGHSYTAYPLGCSAAMAALQLLTDPGINPNVCTPQLPGRCCKAASGGDACSARCGNLLQQWDEAAAAQLSHHKRVKGVMVLGSVLAVELAAAPAGDSSSTTSTGSGGGYGSSAAVDVVAALRRRGVFARPLGPVVYLMVTPTTEPGVTERLLGQLREVLDSEEGWGQAGGDWVLI